MRCFVPFRRFVPLYLLFTPLLLISLLSTSPAFGRQAGPHLQALQHHLQEAQQAARAASQATSEADLKQHVDAVFTQIWGVPSGLTAPDAFGAEKVHGWKTQWQVSYDDFDPGFSARYGNAPPEIADPTQLGIEGEGRFVRDLLQAVVDDEAAPADKRMHAEHVVIALNNVIGWMKIDAGFTKGEMQPRVDLTRVWDAPSEFWRSTADTGWIFEAYAQALNILKTSYEGDLNLAHRHAEDLVKLLDKCLSGVDVDANGRIEPVMMEGGLETALTHARAAGLLAP